jgi:hypothetical protein
LITALAFGGPSGSFKILNYTKPTQKPSPDPREEGSCSYCWPSWERIHDYIRQVTLDRANDCRSDPISRRA